MKRASSLRFSRPKPSGRSGSVVGTCSTVAISDLLVRAVAGGMLGCPADRGDDVLVTGAATDRARDRRAYLVVRRVRVRVEQRAAGHQHPRRTEPALKRVLL